MATIKPTAPNWGHTGFHIHGRRVFCDSQTTSNLISFAYNVDLRQIVHSPGWLRKVKYNVDGIPDLAGAPNLKQMRGLYKNLLASRFHLALRRGTKVLPVYVLRVGEHGPKLPKSMAALDDLPDQTFTRWSTRRIVMRETNATMADFAGMPDAVPDRPVVDETDLKGKFDFVLKWTPGNAPVTNLNAPPEIFTAIREQTGLRLKAAEAPVPVLAIDHIEGPFSN